MKKCKRALSLFMAMLMVFSVFAGLEITSFAADDILSYLKYNISNGEAQITDCNTDVSGDIVIPDTIEGYPVTYIAWYAFDGCANITSVTLPDSVTYLGGYSFRNCSALKSISIPDNVTGLQQGTFMYCTNLTNVKLPENGTYINANVFYECKNLTEIVIPDGVTTIGEMAFSSCEKLVSVSIPDSVSSIGDDAFRFCHSLADITIPYGVTELPQFVFIECVSLTSIIIPDSVKTIGLEAFYNCNGLTTINIPSSVTFIDDYAFESCDNLTSITVDPKNQYYSNDTHGVLFNKEKTELLVYPMGKTDVTYSIPDGVTHIEEYAFRECSLSSVIVPKSVTSIGAGVFYYSENIKDIYYCGTEEEWNNIEISDHSNSKLQSTTIHFEYCVHSNTEIQNAADATCTADGYTGDTYCFDCEKVIAYGETIPATEHTFGEWTIDKEATCTTAGSKSRKCLNCKTEKEVVEIPMTEHSYGEWVIVMMPGYNSFGTRQAVCKNCGDIIAEPLDPLDADTAFDNLIFSSTPILKMILKFIKVIYKIFGIRLDLFFR